LKQAHEVPYCPVTVYPVTVPCCPVTRQ